LGIDCDALLVGLALRTGRNGAAMGTAGFSMLLHSPYFWVATLLAFAAIFGWVIH